jgi:predicted Zn-dependent protease
VRLPAAAAGLAVLLALALTALPPLLSTRLTERAAATWRAAPAAALADLGRAGALNPLSATPALTEGMLALELHRPRRAERAFAQALRRDPSAWYPHLALALLADDRGDRAGARRAMADAVARNPRQPELVRARARLLAGRGGPDPLATQRAVLRRPG